MIPATQGWCACVSCATYMQVLCVQPPDFSPFVLASPQHSLCYAYITGAAGIGSFLTRLT